MQYAAVSAAAVIACVGFLFEDADGGVRLSLFECFGDGETDDSRADDQIVVHRTLFSKVQISPGVTDGEYETYHNIKRLCFK